MLFRIPKEESLETVLTLWSNVGLRGERDCLQFLGRPVMTFQNVQCAERWEPPGSLPWEWEQWHSSKAF